MSIHLTYWRSWFSLDKKIFGEGYQQINDDMMINNPSWIHSRLKSIIESGAPLGDSHSKMFCSHYFYHPIHGLCTCGEILNSYKNNEFRSFISCECELRIIHNNIPYDQVDEDDQYDWLMHHEHAHVPQNYFPKNFRKVIKFETIYVNNRPVICAYTLNLLDVIQTSPNYYQVEVVIFYFIMLKDIYIYDAPYHIFYPGFSQEVLEQYKDIGLKVPLEALFKSCVKEKESRFRYGSAIWHDCSVGAKTYTNNLFNEKKEFLTRECMKLILDWQESGLICEKDLFFDPFSCFNVSADAMKGRYIYYLHIKHKKNDDDNK